MLRKDVKMVSIKWIQFCKIRPGELDLFSLRHKYNWHLYKKIIKRTVKTVQPKNKYSHKEKKEYKQSGINTGWKLFWTLETFSPNQALTKKEITFTKGLVKDEAVVPRVTGEPPSEGDKAALPSPAPFGCRSCIWQESVKSSCIVWFCPWHLQRCRLLFKSRPWLAVSIRNYHIPVFICRLKYWDF